MKEILLASSVLISVLALLRLLLRKHVSARLQYALWLLVVLRLMLPLQFGSLPFSVVSLAESTGPEIEQFAGMVIGERDAVSAAPEAGQTAAASDGVSADASRNVSVSADTNRNVSVSAAQEESPFAAPSVTPAAAQEAQTAPAANIVQHSSALTVGDFLTYLWLAGMAAMAVWFLASNLVLRRKLRRSAQPLTVSGCPLPVYTSDVIVSPCLFGFPRPVIYVTPRCAADETHLRHVLAHESTHYRHRDHVWSLLRCILLCVYWFDPFVWFAAIVSKRDCELACDEGAVVRLGDSERLAYGRTLVDMVAQASKPADLMQSATTMYESKQQLKERIKRIVKKPKNLVLAVICLLTAVVLTVGCTFTGSQSSEDAPATVPPVTETEPAVETEPASQETEGAAFGELFNSPADPGFTSGSRYVVVSDHIFYVSDDGIHMMFEGQDTLLCSGSFQRYLCTDGVLLYAVNQDGNVLQLNLTDGSVKELFNVGTTADVLGASEDVIYIGYQEYGNDWLGYDLCVYSLDGELQDELGEELYASMEDGILCYINFRSDPQTTPFRAYGRDGKLIVEADEVWNYSVQNGTVYYSALKDGETLGDFLEGNGCEMVLYRADRSNGVVELKTFESVNTWITFYGDVLYVDGHFYSLEDGAELTGGIYDKVFVSGDINNRVIGKDSMGKWYCFDPMGLSFFRENDSGEMVDCGKLTENTFFLSICGDWVYSLYYTEPTQVFASYLPVQ